MAGVGARRRMDGDHEPDRHRADAAEHDPLGPVVEVERRRIGEHRQHREEDERQDPDVPPLPAEQLLVRELAGGVRTWRSRWCGRCGRCTARARSSPARIISRVPGVAETAPRPPRPSSPSRPVAPMDAGHGVPRLSRPYDDHGDPTRRSGMPDAVLIITADDYGYAPGTTAASSRRPTPARWTPSARWWGGGGAIPPHWSRRGPRWGFTSSCRGRASRPSSRASRSSSAGRRTTSTATTTATPSRRSPTKSPAPPPSGRCRCDRWSPATGNGCGPRGR